MGFKKEYDNCLSNGRYCALDPDEQGPVNGKLVMEESVRQICLYR